MKTIKLYRPSSGTEGEWFIRNWCGQCERDKCQNGTKAMDDCGPDDLCQIIGDTMFLNVDEPGYPQQWVDAEDGPKCTAFVPVGDPIPIKDTKTIDMFDTAADKAA